MVGMKSQRLIGQIRGLLDRGSFNHVTDAQLLDLVCGDRDANAAFETLVRRHGPSVLRTCRRVLGDHGDADDAFQATFLVLARSAGSLQPAHSVGPWLLGVARRIALKARTAASRRRYHERQTAVSIEFDSQPRFELSQTLRQEVDCLPEHLRAPIVLCYFERLSYKSAAEKLGVTEATVRGRLVKARRLLKARLARDPDAISARSRRRPTASLEYHVPLILLDATTRAAIAFTNRAADKSKVAPAVFKMAEGALKMLFMTRIMHVLAVTVLGAAGAAVVGLQTNVAQVAEAHPAQPANPVQAAPKREAHRDILIQAESIRTIAENDRVSVDGPGTLSLWVDRRLLTNKIDDPAKGARSEPALLRISWTGRMHFIGRTTDAEGRPTCSADFQGQITAQMDDAQIQCEERMRVYMMQPVPLERVQIALKGPASDNLAHHPQTKIAGIQAKRNVIVTGRVVNAAQSAPLHQQRLEAHDALAYDRRKGSYRIDGKGKLILFERASAAPAPANGLKPALQQTEISFSDGMTARVGTDNEADTIAHEAEFFGATVIWTGVAQPTTKADRDGDTSQEGYLSADRLKLSLEPHDPAAHFAQPRARYIKAFGNVQIIGGDMSIQSNEASFRFPAD